MNLSSIFGLRVFLILAALLVLLLIVGVWLKAIRDSQFASHRIVSHLGGQVLSEFTTTNPAYLTFEQKTVVSSNGLQTVSVPVTNYYWHVWRIFK